MSFSRPNEKSHGKSHKFCGRCRHAKLHRIITVPAQNRNFTVYTLPGKVRRNVTVPKQNATFAGQNSPEKSLFMLCRIWHFSGENNGKHNEGMRVFSGNLSGESWHGKISRSWKFCRHHYVFKILVYGFLIVPPFPTFKMATHLNAGSSC